MTNKAYEVLKKIALAPPMMAADIVKTINKTIEPATKELATALQRAEAVSKPAVETAKGKLQMAGESSIMGAHMPANRIMKAEASSLRSARPPMSPTHMPGETSKDIRSQRMSGDPMRPKFAEMLPNLTNKPIATILPKLPPNPPAILKNVMNSTKLAGVVDRSVKEIGDLQWGYRFQRNPYAEANDSMRSRNFLNYEGSRASVKSAEAYSSLTKAVNNGLGDETEGHEYWLGMSKKLRAKGHTVEAQKAEHFADQELHHHALLEHLKNKIEKKAEELHGGLHEIHNKKSTDFDSQQMKWGIEIEKEHTPVIALRKQITMDHLTEDPKYYTKLRKQEHDHEEAVKAGKEKGIIEEEKKASLIKQAFIREENGRFNVYSHTGKRMGSYAIEAEAKHRLQQIEYFKKQGAVDLFQKRFKKYNPTNEVGSEVTARGVSPELALEIAAPPDVLSKGASLDMAIYLRNRKTLLS